MTGTAQEHDALAGACTRLSILANSLGDTHLVAVVETPGISPPGTDFARLQDAADRGPRDGGFTQSTTPMVSRQAMAGESDRTYAATLAIGRGRSDPASSLRGGTRMSTRVRAIAPLAISIGVVAFLWSEFALNFSFHWVTVQDGVFGKFGLPEHFQLVLLASFVTWGLLFVMGADDAALRKTLIAASTGTVAAGAPERGTTIMTGSDAR